MAGLEDFIKQAGGKNKLIGAGIGAAAGHFLSPKRQNVPAVTKAQLDATTMPQMERMANRRLAHLQGAQGSKGGLSSGDLFERSNLRTQLGEGLATQSAFNTISANQAAQQAADRDYQARMDHFRNVMSGGLMGANFFPSSAPAKKEEKPKQAASVAIPKPSYTGGSGIGAPKANSAMLNIQDYYKPTNFYDDFGMQNYGIGRS